MGKTVLFSPVGNTDPIRDCYDGGMLHICRHYRPDVVYLYLSKEMLEHHRRDNRYVATIRLLEEKIGHKFGVITIERPELTEPHIFDAFYNDFESLLNEIAESNPDEILLNISSGTPAMKAALQTIAAMSDNLYIPIQVASPENASNKTNGNHNDYEIKLNWDCNIDNTPQAQCRCSKSRFENLNAKIKKEIIYAHIDSYDYEAALSVARGMRSFVKPKSLDMLQAARLRLAMEFPQARQKLKDAGLRVFKRQPEHEKLLESILWLQVKEKRREFVDFIRGITPVVTELFRVCLKNKCGVDIRQYCVYRGNDIEKNYLKRSILEKEAPDILEILDRAFAPRDFTDTYISSANMSVIIKALCAGDDELTGLVDKLNAIDGEQVRHIAAHTLTAITDEYVKKQTGYYCREIIILIKKSVG